MDSIYWNEEDSVRIICPYCATEYEPSYEDTFIGGYCVDCYDADIEQLVTCDNCKKKFTIRAYQDWRYTTETIEGEMTQKEWEANF